MKTTDKLKLGEKLEPLIFNVTTELNDQILESLSCCDDKYKIIVHPALLVGFSNVTRSPSYLLDDGVAAMHTHDEIEFFKEGKVGDTFRVTWEVVYIYHRKNKFWEDIEYQVMDAVVTDSLNEKIIKRRMNDIYLRKNIQG